MKRTKGSIALYLIIGIVIVGGFFLTGGLFNYQYTNQNIPGAFVPLSPSPDNSQKSIQFHAFKFLYLTPTPTPVLGGNGNCPLPTQNSSSNLSSLVSTIKSTYGITLSGDALTLTRAEIVAYDMCLLFSSPTYRQSLNSITHPVSVEFLNVGTCFAYTYANPEHVEMWEPCDVPVDEYVFVHELTHVMQFGSANGRNAHWSAWQQVWSTGQNHKIPTGPCYYEDRGDGGECEADAVAEYLYYPIYRNSWGGSPAGNNNLLSYPSEWASWYNFVSSQFFGGMQYHL